MLCGRNEEFNGLFALNFQFRSTNGAVVEPSQSFFTKTKRHFRKSGRDYGGSRQTSRHSYNARRARKFSLKIKTISLSRLGLLCARQRKEIRSKVHPTARNLAVDTISLSRTIRPLFKLDMVCCRSLFHNNNSTVRRRRRYTAFNSISINISSSFSRYMRANIVKIHFGRALLMCYNIFSLRTIAITKITRFSR